MLKSLKQVKFAALAILFTALTACGNLSKVTDEGTIKEGTEIVWPQIEKSKFNHDGSQFGSWPNLESLKLVELNGKGMNKDQLQNLLGRPHFAEGLYGVQEWDYVFNFNENGQHKICQYKILFNKHHNAQSFFWNPEGCYGTKDTLSADYLFDFDSAKLTEQGTKAVNELAEKLQSAKLVIVKGFPDQLGSGAYNAKLSQARAEAVAEQLKAQGVQAEIITKAHGESQPVVKPEECKLDKEAKLSKEQLIKCLAPNRRAEVVSL